MNRTENASIDFSAFIKLFAQLLLIGAVIWVYRVEHLFGFYKIMPVIVGGFVVHAFTPFKYRPALLFALSVIGMIVLLPPIHVVALLAIGIGLIAICHIPIKMWMRVVLLLVVGAALAAARADLFSPEVVEKAYQVKIAVGERSGGLFRAGWRSLPSIVLPIIGAMFIFRILIYLFDIRHEKPGTSIWQRLSYFFMLPNFVFLLFPVIDYTTYKKNYYNKPSAEIYQRGISWMFRGVIHLLLYRIVYIHLVPSASEVEGLFGVAGAMVSTYLMYLRVSGQFHLIVGIMLLFGHNLPETNNLYFLASSFSDYWRRINIYWKDFMAKIFYYPAFVRFKKLGVYPAVILSTMYVFLATWLLHAYQWFWLRGVFPISLTDGLFWFFFGLLALGSQLIEMRSPRKRVKGFHWKNAFIHSGKVLATFSSITILWSLWSSKTMAEFLSLVGHVTDASITEVFLFVLVLAAIILIGAIVQYVVFNIKEGTLVIPAGSETRKWYQHAVAVMLLILAMPPVLEQMSEEKQDFLATINSEQLNRKDQEVLERGYYESLLEPTDYLSALWSTKSKRPPGWNTQLSDIGAAKDTSSLLLNVLVPSVNKEWKETAFRTNQWGMRDREYAAAKPEGTYRYALLGASTEMGWGVENVDVFEAIVEQKMNEALADSGPDVEILNFSVPSYTVLQSIKQLETQVGQFNPDEIFLVAHGNYARRLFDVIGRANERGIDLEYDYLTNLMEELEIDSSHTRSELFSKLRPRFDDIVDWAYGHVAEYASQNGIKVSVLYIPSLGGSRADNASYDAVKGHADKYGFDIYDLRSAIAGVDESQLQLAPWDTHPNKRAHRMIANELHEQLLVKLRERPVSEQ